MCPTIAKSAATPASSVPAGKESASERHRGQSFECIENQRKHAQGRRRARDVGGANVAAAGEPDILSAKNAQQNKTKGNRSEQIADSGGKKNAHRFS